MDEHDTSAAEAQASDPNQSTSDDSISKPDENTSNDSISKPDKKCIVALNTSHDSMSDPYQKCIDAGKAVLAESRAAGITPVDATYMALLKMKKEYERIPSQCEIPEDFTKDFHEDISSQVASMLEAAPETVVVEPNAEEAAAVQAGYDQLLGTLNQVIKENKLDPTTYKDGTEEQDTGSLGYIVRKYNLEHKHQPLGSGSPDVDPDKTS